MQITRRYAEFSAAIVGISEQFPNELVSRLLLELQNEVECFIMKMAAVFTTRKEQLIYLINNYDMVLSVLLEHTRDNSKEAESFREQLNARSGEYVEEILAPHFGGVMQFVKEMEMQQEKNPSEPIQYNEHKALMLVTKRKTEGLEETVSKLNDDDKQSLLSHATTWNTNSRNTRTAQLVLGMLLKETLMGTFRPENMNKLVEDALPYTERHFKRLTEYLTSIKALEFTMKCMQPHASSQIDVDEDICRNVKY